MLKSKIHRATVTDANLHYEGSLTIDVDLMRAADILENERVWVYNIASGQRFDTYAIEGPAGSGAIRLNGAAARMGQKGDLIIIVSFAMIEASQVDEHRPIIILMDDMNKISKRLRH
jgi:aspartate 1-decarboxylase